ncbi:hypothetical protein BJV82DRAFT_637332 [Fennellomyces sp. T-0311]|nr:hypothetical protein BJV82DRAFT_637332 [Fennellomyces sp. T-0311]
MEHDDIDYKQSPDFELPQPYPKATRKVSASNVFTHMIFSGTEEEQRAKVNIANRVLGATSTELKTAYQSFNPEERESLKNERPSGLDRSKHRLLRVMVEMDEVLDMDIITLLAPRTRLFEDGEVATEPVYSSETTITAVERNGLATAFITACRVQCNAPARTRTETERSSDLAEIFRRKEVEITGKSVKRFLWYQYEKVEDRDGKCCYQNKKRRVDIVGYDFKKHHAVKPKRLSAEAQDLLDKVNSNEVRLLRSEGE